MPFELIEIPAGKRGKRVRGYQTHSRRQEGEQMLAAAGKNPALLPRIFRARSRGILRRSWPIRLERWKLR